MSARRSVKILLGVAAVAIESGVAALALAGSVSAGTPDRSTSCDAPSADLITLEKKSPNEPLIRVLQPKGWVRETDMDSKAIRLMLIGPELRSDGGMPQAFVAVIKGPGLPAAAVDRERTNRMFEEVTTGLKKLYKADLLASSETTVCGNQARMVTFDTQLGRDQELLVFVPGPCDSHMVTLSVRSSNADDVTYQADLNSMMSRFQVLNVTT